MKSRSDLTRTRKELEAGIASGLHLGGQLCVSLGGEAVAELAFGEVRPGEPMRPDHLPLWLSMTKPVAAVAIGQLWQAGSLGLDDPVARHVPEFSENGKGAITVRHLLTHTAGLRLLDTGWPKSGWDEIVARICAMRPEPRWQPGLQAGYHRASSWFLLGEIVRRLDGRPFERYVREGIFEPLGMDDCWIGIPPERFEVDADRLAPIYDTTKAPPADFGWTSERFMTQCSPGVNGVGPMDQLARFYECLLHGGSHSGVRLLSPQTLEALTARHRVGLVDKTFRRPLDWGLGFVLNSRYLTDDAHPYGYGPHASRRAYGHSGYRSSTAFADPEHGLVVALAFNGAPGDDEHLCRVDRICRAIYEDLELTREPVSAVV